MLGVHVNFTKPSFNKRFDQQNIDNLQEKNVNNYSKSNKHYMHDYDILTTILSALSWKKNMGQIKLFTDSEGFMYYKETGLLDLWDGGIDTSLDSFSFDEIDVDIFWAAGKIYAISQQNTPFVLLDTDIIVWESINRFIENEKLVCVHKEPIGCYFPMENLIVKNNYVYDESWKNNHEDPANTALIYFGDKEFKDYYVKKSFDFMKHADPDKSQGWSYGQYIIFAEQRMVVLCAKQKNIDVKYIFKKYIPKNNQKIMTHIWGSKFAIRNDDKLRTEFCTKLINRIVNENPHFKEKLLNIPELSPYFDYIRSEFK
jgi:hypothetical protein